MIKKSIVMAVLFLSACDQPCTREHTGWIVTADGGYYRRCKTEDQMKESLTELTVYGRGRIKVVEDYRFVNCD